MIYIFVFFSSAFFAYLAERSKNKDMIILYSAISILIPSILGGLRAYGVGTDTYTYGRPDALQALNSPGLIYFIEHNRCEFGYKILVYFVMQIFGHENWCYFFQQLITISGIYIGAWRHKKILSVTFTLLVFLLICYNQSYNAIRQLMAESVIFMGISYIEKGQYKKFLPYAIVATSFHLSAFIQYILIIGIHLLAASDILSKHQRIKNFIAYMSLGLMFVSQPVLVFLTNHIAFLTPYIAYASNMSNSSGTISNSMTSIVFGGLLLLILFHKGALRTYSKIGVNNLDFQIYIAVFLLIYMYFVRFMALRIVMYEQVLNFILLVSLPCSIKEKNLRIIVYAVIIAVSLFYFWFIYIYKGSSMTWPYRSIL